MKRKIYIILSLMLCILMLNACAGRYDRISQELGIDISEGNVQLEDDTHGGFHNDGILRLKVEFPEKMNTAGEGWQELPMPEDVVETCEMVHEIDEFLPHTDDGFWFYADRSGGGGAVNFTLAVYDSSTDILYYCSLDT